MDTVAALYRRWLCDLWHGDFSAAEEIFAPGIVGHWPAFDVHGPQGMVGQVRQSYDYFEDIKVTLDVGPVVGDALVAAHWTFHGTYRGGIPGATAPAAPGSPSPDRTSSASRTAVSRSTGLSRTASA